MSDNIIFEPKGHRYTVNGEEVPSVSEIIRFAAHEVYGDISPIRLDQAANKGTRVHKATEELDSNGATEVDEDIAGYVEAYRAFLLAHFPEWVFKEKAVNFGTEYAGTLDRFGTINGRLTLVDIKTNATLGKAHKTLYGIQLNLYRKALESKEIEVDEMYLLHLKKDGTYKLVKVERDDKLADACLLLHKSFQKQKRKKKG